MSFDMSKANIFVLDMLTGISKDYETSKRYLSNMKGMFADEQAVEDMMKKENSLVYEFY